MTVPIPTTRQFTTAGGVLGLDRSAIPRVVVENTKESTADGPFGQQAPSSIYPSDEPIEQSLKTMIDQRVHWKNDYGSAVTVQVQIQRARRTMYTSAPNYAFIRERYTTRVGVDSPFPVLAPEPDPTTIWNTEWGGGIDVGVKRASDGGGWVPNYGQFRLSTPESGLHLPLMRLAPNQAIDVRYRASLITPYLWWENVPEQDKAFEMYAFSNTIRMVAYPEPVAQ